MYVDPENNYDFVHLEAKLLGSYKSYYFLHKKSCKKKKHLFSWDPLLGFLTHPLIP